jgi:UDP-N-acetylglucosamine--N-acetylmuramyl-(pentapeptide) pyrophosphoryl-undecaprenol N-acetylglucosamine transferase
MNERAQANTSGNTVAIVVGSTPGHIHPARAVGEAFARRAPGTNVLIVDTPQGLGARLLASTGWPHLTIAALPFAGVGAGAKLRSMAAAGTSILPARRLLRANGVRLVLGMGAYVSASVVLAARTAGIATAIHEANVVPGLANRLLAPLADRVYLGHQVLSGQLTSAGRRSVFVGNPVRASIAALAGAPRYAPERGRAVRVLVTCNTRGGPFFTRVLPQLVAQVARAGVKVEVLHQCGDDAPGVIASHYRAAAVPARVLPHLDDMADAYRWADFAVARGGSGTLAELSLAGVPALVVPLSGAAWDHQAANARAWESAGAGFWSREDVYDQGGALAARAGALLADARAWQAASDKARALMPADAADRIVADCQRLFGAGA